MKTMELLEQIKTYIEKYNDNDEVMADSINYMLDELLNEDFFGTEGQLDPRGDRRNI